MTAEDQAHEYKTNIQEKYIFVNNKLTFIVISVFFLLLFTRQCHLVKGERNVCRFFQRANGQGKWKCQKESRDIFHPVSLRME